MIRAAIACVLMVAGTAPAQERVHPVDAALTANGFGGFALVASGDAILWQTPRAPCRPSSDDVITLCHPRDPAQLRWPWASVSKQVLAILTMQQVDAGKLALDTPADRYLPALGGGTAPTVRQLLQHRSGLRNPNDSPPDGSGNPGFYSTGPTGLGWCLADRASPGGDWRYNNCDSIVLGAVLERVTGKPLPALFADQLGRPLKLEGSGYAGESEARLPPRAKPLPPGYAVSFARYGAAGGLAGTGADLLAIDRALLAGRLMSPTARDVMWAGDLKLGYMALAQWAFEAPLKGCTGAVRIIERRGGIGRYQVRNIILPDHDRIIILFTDQETLEFGEIWQGKGLSYDLLSAAACAGVAK